MSSPARTQLEIFALAVVLTACGPGSAVTTRNAGSLAGEVLVSAAASLTDAFAEIERAFESAHPGVDVTLNLGGTPALREQIIEGAPADVLASANTSNMDLLVESGEVRDDPHVFATNSLQIAVPAGNPAGIRSLDDFGRDELLIGLCAFAVPCGEFAREALARSGVKPSVDTDEPDVRALLTKIEVGELDAGITYVTDILSTGGSVEGVVIPDGQNVVARYSIAVLAGAPNVDAAAEFVDFVMSDLGQAILAEYGFGPP